MLCVIVPFLALSWDLPQGWHEPEARHSAVAALLAQALGFWLHRNLEQLPGNRESSGIMPAYLVSFSAALAAILLLRVPYSRAMLLAGFGLTVAWFWLVYFVSQRARHLALGLVSGGHVGIFIGMQGVNPRMVGLEEWPHDLDAITADFRQDHSPEWTAKLADYALGGLPVYHSKDLYESLTGKADLEHLSENNLGALNPQSSLLLAKTIVDRLLALPVLLALLPLLAVIAIAIRLDSPGPALFRQRRIGYRGREFTVVKFRTMRDAPGEAGGTERFITCEGDPRITRLGALLRRCRIDELPQIFNVLMGQMSWIGPRPEAAALSDWYAGEIPFYRYRYVVRPGISGWAQVNQGHVSAIEDVHEKLQFDFYYIRHFSIWLDLLIVAKTIRTMLTGFGHK